MSTMLSELSAYQRLTIGPVGYAVTRFADRHPLRVWILPMDLPWAGAWWFGIIVFPHKFTTLPIQITTPWLAHEITHQMQGKARGTRSPLRGTLYRELEANIIGSAVRYEIAEAEGDAPALEQARQTLRTFTGDPEMAYEAIRRHHWIYRTPLYRWREPAAEAAGWRRTLPELGFGPDAMSAIERYRS